MHRHFASLDNWHKLPILFAGVVSLITLAACSVTSEQPALPAAIVDSTPTLGNPSPTALSKWALATADAQRDIEFRTAVALSPTIDKSQLSFGTPEPTWTPQMGMLPGCVNATPRGPQCLSAWRGVVNGQITDVQAGQYGSGGDELQGLVLVHTWGQAQDDIYDTPQRVGAVRIATVNGTLFTLTPDDPQYQVTFYFDLASRQWTPSTPGPSPSVPVSPMPSVSPLPTQQP